MHPITTTRVFLLFAAAAAGLAQPVDPLNVEGKLGYHANCVYSPASLAEVAVYAGYHQEAGTPREWGQGSGAYAERAASALGYSAIHEMLAFGVDSASHQDPRYYRSLGTGFWRRSGHAFRETILTHTDRGGETLSTWRLGSAYGAAFLSNQWYPDRLNTVRLGVLQGTLRLGFDFATNLGAEFGPDIKRKLMHRRQ
jgi:hypothetical protein